MATARQIQHLLFMASSVSLINTASWWHFRVQNCYLQMLCLCKQSETMAGAIRVPVTFQ